MENTAERIVARFGGQSALARLIGKGQSTVAHWVKIGRIPAKWQPELLGLAEENGISLTASDFMLSPGLKIEKRDNKPPGLPKATWWGVLPIGDAELPVFVLNDGQRVVSRTGATGL